MSERTRPEATLAGWRQALLRFLKVPPEPEDPMGREESVRVFRAAPAYFRYKLVVWGLRQVGSLVGLGLVLVFEATFLAEIGPGALRKLVLVVFVLTVVGAVAQAVVSLAVIRLDFELRWYKVSDEALRIREGVVQVREMTMTFANIQHISLTQGPIQRWLGIADVQVKSAGGGSGGGHDEKKKPGALDMHTAYFRGVDNAETLRDLMRRRLQAARGAGLGDPDDHHEAPPPAPPAPLHHALATLLGEAAALREAAERAASS